MTSFQFFVKVTFLLIVLTLKGGFCFRCDRRPYGSTAPASPADGRFELSLIDDENNAYIPEQVYTVQISATDDNSKFTSFMLSAEGDTKPDPRNPRKKITLFPGDLRPQSYAVAKYSERCLYSVEQAVNSYKSSVEVYWQAPPSGNGCVTLRAMVVENDEIWYEDGMPLTKKLCEDLRQPDDVAPQINENCQICDEAKYEITFTGIWSRNTHPRLYPENDWTPRYSDLVGASHTTDYILWSPGTEVSEGFRELAEYANSSSLESEIRGKIGSGVRTIIKGKGHGYRKMNNPTYAFFRTDKHHHLVSAAIAFHPSPDWFLGVSRFELCQEDNTWLQERELNLYPWDAGTDSGISYESPNIVTYPKDAVSRVQMSSYDKHSPFYETDIKQLTPFGKMHIRLIRTYRRECEEESSEEETTETETQPPTTVEVETTETEESGELEVTEDPKLEEPDPPSRYQNTEINNDARREDPLDIDPEASEDCPMSQWQEWSPCEGACEDGKLIGYKWRERYHLVDGIPVEKYDPHIKISQRKEVTKFCKKHYEVFERVECEEDCYVPNDDEEFEEEIKVQRRIMPKVVHRSHWRSKKRELYRTRI